MSKDCGLCVPYGNNPTIIKQFSHWTLFVNYMQPTLGSTLVVLNRHVENFSDIRLYEHVDYWNIASELEKSLRLSFNPERINHLMLANAVKHIHYHIVPRYRQTQIFASEIFKDENFGRLPILIKSRLDSRILEAVKTRILENL